MEIPRALQDYRGSGADDAAPCILRTVDGPVRTRAGGTRSVLQREDDDDGPAEEAVNQEDGAPLLDNAVTQDDDVPPLLDGVVNQGAQLLRVGAVVDAAAVAFGETYVEQARNGSGPQKFRGTIVAATVKANFWNVQYEADGKIYATEATRARRRLPRARRGVVAGRVRVPRRASPRKRGAIARRLEPSMDAVDAMHKLESYST